MRLTDFGMLAYWGLSALMAAQLINIPGEWLFKGYDDPLVQAWNWSFLPLDLALAVTGILALRLEKAGDARWKILCAISLTLTVCAGLMAISYWALTADFDPTWWIPNLFLMLWPIPYLVAFVCEGRQPSGLT